jgi:hypothetical protein
LFYGEAARWQGSSIRSALLNLPMLNFHERQTNGNFVRTAKLEGQKSAAARIKQPELCHSLDISLKLTPQNAFSESPSITLGVISKS